MRIYQKLKKLVRISKAPGFWKRLYEGFWDGTSANPNLNWFSSADLLGGESDANIDLSITSPSEGRTYGWTGFYESKWTLPIKFRLTSDGNAVLLVNGKIAIDKMGETGESETNTVESKTKLLKRKRRNPITLYYSNKGAGNVKLEWKYDIDFENWKSSDFSKGYFFHSPVEERSLEY